MKIPLFQVDAFTEAVFGGNPAAVCPLPRWISAPRMQAIAAENNLAETAFLVGGGGRYRLRWFTPALEVDLCGHATLAAAWVVFNVLEKGRREVAFSTRSGTLRVGRQARGLLAMDFPSRPPQPCRAPAALLAGLGRAPREVWGSRDYLCVYDREDDVKALRPDMEKLLTLDKLGVIATARGRKVDFVSRFFAPRAGIPEDPVTGSAHCTLIPYWAEKLGKAELRARQVSPRVGELACTLRGPRVTIAGHAVLYLKGTIEVP
jgi:predicted PhzF superfamily epimerase YddE/YHI9